MGVLIRNQVANALIEEVETQGGSLAVRVLRDKCAEYLKDLPAKERILIGVDLKGRTYLRYSNNGGPYD